MQPIVLAHGFLGYRRFLLWELFPGVEEMFKEQGILALRPVVHPTASIEERAGELLERIDQKLGQTESYHIIAHSMGGLDSRFLASPNGLAQGNRVLSLTTISTPHRGASLAERIPPPLQTAYARGAGILRHMISGEESATLLDRIAENRWAGLMQLTPAYLCDVFNPTIRNDSRVRYFSYAGSLARKNDASILTFLRKASGSLGNGDREENDGLVTVESARWGEFKGILPADHGEQIGLQIIPGLKNSFDHIRFFLAMVQDLQKLECGSTSRTF
ncbi:MAG: hypothetical protein C4527_05925 [Candidatus Omnitrophota bacterium]|jgi:triacylglycerol lipase|nr:MAG: hypothetical protein C4527_05925 [Candidatus Omnitrophota bacterium]